MSRSNSTNHKDWKLDCKIYVGDLGYGAAKQELEEKFAKYGPLRNVWIARKPPGFAFVEFEDPRDAEDAARGLDGSSFSPRRRSRSLSRGRSRSPSPRRRSRSRSIYSEER
ncbi:RNA-binding protein 1 isoform X3 [Patella vulgata]|uniref:RNA-binding protein 1 isoform X3 n=1 Tax=Patella vulgata TaxID=6465 RepID=UPI00217F6C4E|nr:RNA-binding protein 1 isoform X3 [Patella vulgata]